MKKCLFCAEEIQDDAIKCRYCGEFLSQKRPAQKEWYFRGSILVVGILCVGPFALPLLWFNPAYSRAKKISISIIVFILSYILVLACVNAAKNIQEYYGLITQ